MTVRRLLRNQPITVKGDLPSRDMVEIIQRIVDAVNTGGSGVSDGDKGDIVVSGSGTTWTIDVNAVTNAKMADMATARIKGRVAGGTGDPEDLTGTQATTLLDLATTSLKGLAPARSGVAGGTGDPEDLTGTQATTLLDLATTSLKGLAPARSGVATEYLDGTGVYSVPPGGAGTNLTYTAATRVIASDTGTDATLPLVTPTEAGLAPLSGGGTTNFLRADGTWAAAGGGGLSGSATLNLATGRFEHSETVTATGVTGAQRINVWLDPASDADENVPEMLDILSMAAAPGTGQITVTAAFAIPTSGPVKIQWSAF